jgi:Tfp pilus assembly protein PilX
MHNLTRPQNGIALISVLILLAICSMFSLYSIESNIWDKKILNNQLQKNHIFNITKEILQQIESHPLNSLCFTTITSTPDLLHKSFSEWQSLNTCHGIEDSVYYYYYVIESLGSNSCVQVSKSSKKLVVNYFRITIMAFENNNFKGAKVILQSTLATATKEAPLCSRAVRKIHLGQQSFIEL